MNIRRNIQFCIEHRKKNGQDIILNVPIRARVSFNCQRCEIYTGHRIDIAKWDADKQRVKNGSFNKAGLSSSQINADLQKQSAILQEIFEEYERLGQYPTKAELVAAFDIKARVKAPEETEDKPSVPAKTNSPKEAKRRPGRPPKTDQEQENSAPAKAPAIWPLIDQFVREQGRENAWTHGTHEKFNAMRSHLQRFNQLYKPQADLTLEDFTEPVLKAYVDFLMKYEDMRNTTVGKHLAYLKWFLRWAVRNKHTETREYETSNPKLKKVKPTIIFLTKPELDALRSYSIPAHKQYIERVRDVYLFCCFTGLRYSDVENLRWGNVKENSIEVTTIKTNDTVIINLNKQSRAILDKYRETPLPGGRVLPVITNQKMNDYLKELCKMAGIDTPVYKTYYKNGQRIEEVRPKYELIGTHTARKTFISNALMMGIPPEVVMKYYLCKDLHKSAYVKSFFMYSPAKNIEAAA